MKSLFETCLCLFCKFPKHNRNYTSQYVKRFFIYNQYNLISRTPVAAERRTGPWLHLRCTFPMLHQLQNTVRFFSRFTCISGLLSMFFPNSMLQPLNLFLIPHISAALPHPHTALPSALVPVVGAVASQPGLPSSKNAFQVRVIPKWQKLWSVLLNHLVIFVCFFIVVSCCCIALYLHTDLCGTIAAATCWSGVPITNCPIHGWVHSVGTKPMLSNKKGDFCGGLCGDVTVWCLIHVV